MQKVLVEQDDFFGRASIFYANALFLTPNHQRYQFSFLRIQVTSAELTRWYRIMREIKLISWAIKLIDWAKL